MFLDDILEEARRQAELEASATPLPAGNSLASLGGSLGSQASLVDAAAPPVPYSNVSYPEPLMSRSSLWGRSAGLSPMATPVAGVPMTSPDTMASGSLNSLPDWVSAFSSPDEPSLGNNRMAAAAAMRGFNGNSPADARELGDYFGVPRRDSVLPGFWQGLVGGSAEGMNTPVPTLFANEQGPLNTGQRRSDWRNEGGVMINDGVPWGGQALPSNPVGAGYTSRDPVTGRPTPIPFSTDADFGARAGMSAYTDPMIQNMIRNHQNRMELQGLANAGDIAKAEIVGGVRAASDADRRRIGLERSASNPMLPMSSRMAAIDAMDVSPAEKTRSKLEMATSKVDAKSKQLVPIGDSTPTGEMSLGPLLEKVPQGIDPSELFGWLSETRGIGADSLMNYATKLKATGSAEAKKVLNRLASLGLLREQDVPSPETWFDWTQRKIYGNPATMPQAQPVPQRSAAPVPQGLFQRLQGMIY